MIKSKRYVFFPRFTNRELYKIYCTDRKYKRKCILLNIYLAIIMLLIILASFYPYEGHFLTFKSVNDSLAYKNIDTQDITTCEYDDCVFVIDNDNYTIYSVTKDNNRYKLVDFNSESLEYTQPKRVGSERTTNPQFAKFNKETEKTFYLLGVETTTKPSDVLLDGNKMTLYKEVMKQHQSKSTQNKYWIYSYADHSQPKPNFVIEADNFKALIYKTPYIKGLSDR